MNEKLSADGAILEAVQAALNGGRTYGIAQHKVAIRNLAMRITAAEEADVDVYVNAICGIANISATQQKLEKAGKIDRAKKEQVKANIFAALKA